MIEVTTVVIGRTLGDAVETLEQTISAAGTVESFTDAALIGLTGEQGVSAYEITVRFSMAKGTNKTATLRKVERLFTDQGIAIKKILYLGA